MSLPRNWQGARGATGRAEGTPRLSTAGLGARLASGQAGVQPWGCRIRARGGGRERGGAESPDHPGPEDHLPVLPLQSGLQACVLTLQPPQQLQRKPEPRLRQNPWGSQTSALRPRPAPTPPSGRCAQSPPHSPGPTVSLRRRAVLPPRTARPPGRPVAPHTSPNCKPPQGRWSAQVPCPMSLTD